MNSKSTQTFTRFLYKELTWKYGGQDVIFLCMWESSSSDDAAPQNIGKKKSKLFYQTFIQREEKWYI